MVFGCSPLATMWDRKGLPPRVTVSTRSEKRERSDEPLLCEKFPSALLLLRKNLLLGVGLVAGIEESLEGRTQFLNIIGGYVRVFLNIITVEFGHGG